LPAPNDAQAARAWKTRVTPGNPVIDGSSPASYKAPHSQLRGDKPGLVPVLEPAGHPKEVHV
jgi:hypothetical protein